MGVSRRSLIAAPFLWLPSRSAGRRTNVVVFMTDDHGAWAMGAYGCHGYAHPRTGQLAAEGARFTRAYACTPALFAQPHELSHRPDSLATRRPGLTAGRGQLGAEVAALSGRPPHLLGDPGQKRLYAGDVRQVAHGRRYTRPARLLLLARRARRRAAPIAIRSSIPTAPGASCSASRPTWWPTAPSNFSTAPRTSPFICW